MTYDASYEELAATLRRYCSAYAVELSTTNTPIAGRCLVPVFVLDLLANWPTAL